MEEKYKIGRHEFDSQEEWENALKDLHKIKSIVDHVDIDDPKQAIGIYKVIREGRITFVSDLGAAFLCDLSDRVVEYSQDTMAEDTRKNQSQKSFAFKIVGIGCMVLAIVCFLIYGYFEYREREATRELERVQDEKNISQAINWYFERLRSKEDNSGDTGGITEIVAATETVEESVSQGRFCRNMHPCMRNIRILSAGCR